MPKTDPWPMIHAERKALLSDLEGLSDDQWATPSLCTGWSVQQVVGHMTSAAKTTAGSFFGGFIGSGFRFNAFNAKGADKEAAGTPAETLARFRDVLERTTHPPGPVEAMLGEAVVHPEDIRRPLGITRAYPPETVIGAIDFYSKSNLLIGGKRRAAGLTFRATDADWSMGSGPEVSGPLVSIALAITGRAAAMPDLSGDGSATLQSRM